MCGALTSALDLALQALAGEFEPGSNLAVVAIGGYGRSELSLFSDVDLMLLHDVDDPSEAAAALFRPLWDAGLRLGHAVRNAREAARAARERIDTFTTLLTSRLVAGDEELFGRFTSEIAAITKARPLRRYLVDDESRRREHSPYLLMATNVKTGRGGLRTLHGFEWERRREGLIGRFSTESGPEEELAGETLLQIRNGLHAATGRPHDVYTFDLREGVARWLGVDEYAVGSALVQAMHTVDVVASQRWPQLVDANDSLGRKVWSRLRARGEASDGDYLPAASEFATILGSGEQGRLTLERLRESGHLARILPEWDLVRGVPQLAPFHEHPLDAHLWRTVDEMLDLAEGTDRHYADIAEEVDAPDLLVMAAFLHDIGKGRGGDHAEVGADIARAFCDRLLCHPDFSMMVEGAVRHHLLLSQVATRRDLDDPAVIAEVAETIGDLRLLQVLYLLTVADSKATGATMWNKWKATLVRTLFVRCAAHFGGEGHYGRAAGTTRDEVLAQAGEARRPAVEAHVGGMPEEYLRGTSADEVVWHLELIEESGSGAALGIRSGEAAATAVLVGRGHRDVRRVAAEVFAANGIDVLEARMATRTDGVIVDTFRVRDDRTGGPVPPETWERARTDVEAALAGTLDTESKVAARAEAYSSVGPNEVVPRVRVSVDDASNDGVITIRCSDRIGRLAEVLSILHDCDLEIRLAKLDSRGGELIDTFHIRRASLPTDPRKVVRLEQRIAGDIKA